MKERIGASWQPLAVVPPASRGLGGLANTGLIQRRLLTRALLPATVRRVLRLPCLLALAALLLWSGCSDSSAKPDIKPKGAHLSRKQAIRIAKDAASGHGVDLAQFSDPNTRFDSSGEKSWAILFEGNGSMRAHDLLVIVNDRTEQARCFDQ